MIVGRPPLVPNWAVHNGQYRCRHYRNNATPYGYCHILWAVLALKKGITLNEQHLYLK